MNADDEALIDAMHQTLADAAMRGFTFAEVAARGPFSEAELRAEYGTEAKLYFAVGMRGWRSFTDEVRRGFDAAETTTESLDALIAGTMSFFGRQRRVFRQVMHWSQLVGAERLGFTPESLQRDYYPLSGSLNTRLVETMEKEWGSDLPTGIHPRRHAWVCNLALIGHQLMTGFAEAIGDPLLHTEEDMTDDISRVMSAPLAILKQLGGLNDVAAELAGFRRESELVSAMPRLLASALDLDTAGALVVSGETHLLATSSSSTLTTLADPSRLSKPLADCLADGELRVELEGEPVVAGETRVAAPWILCPLPTSHARLGAIFAQPPAGATIDRGLLSRVQTFATMAGMALENVRLYENLQAEVDARTRELEEAQASLVRAAKLASLGQLVAGVSHELNTPLGALQSASDSLSKAAEMLEGDYAERSVEPPRPFRIVKSSSDTMSQAAERVSTVVRRLKRFARLDEADVQRVDVHACIDDAIEMLASSLPAEVEIVTSYGDVPEMLLRPRDLNDLFLNLLMNAAQASTAGGRIVVQTRSSDGSAVVEIEDEGSGIDPADLPRIFDPGFTTRGVRVGVGLGLATCHQIVEAHEGRIEVTSELGRGTKVTVRLPVRR